MDKIKKNMKRILGNINKIGLKNKCFTIISNNCWGGFVYQKFNLQYRTPFVGLFIFAPDYIELLENFDILIEKKLFFIDAGSSKYKEELAEIDMYNIRYLSSKNEIVCNLVKQNIQDERIILELNSKFITMNSSIISFIINDGMIELFTKELGYDVVYKSFVIVKE